MASTRSNDESANAGRSILVGIIGIREALAAGVRFEDGALPAEVVAEVDAGLAGIERDLDHELNPSVGAPPPDRVTCGECGLIFTWPGEREEHLRWSHGKAA
jgi:hypothetical protein